MISNQVASRGVRPLQPIVSVQVDTDAIKQQQSAALSSVQKALDSSMKAGVKRAASETAKPPVKKPRYQSESDEADSDADSGSDSEGEPAAAPSAKKITSEPRNGRRSKDILPLQAPLQEAVG